MTPPALQLDPHFLPSPEQLHDWLQTHVQWDERMKARKTASFGVAYNYAQMVYDAAPMPAPLDALCTALASHIGFRPNNCLLNHYADGYASMGFHSDETESLVPGTGVAIVSVGSVRTIVYRSKLERSIEFAYRLESGSLLYMSQQIQHDWLHAIPRTAAPGERISLTFRAMRSGAVVA